MFYALHDGYLIDDEKHITIQNVFKTQASPITICITSNLTDTQWHHLLSVIGTNDKLQLRCLASVEVPDWFGVVPKMSLSTDETQEDVVSVCVLPVVLFLIIGTPFSIREIEEFVVPKSIP